MSLGASTDLANGRARFTIPDAFGLRVFRRIRLEGAVQVAVAACLLVNIIVMITTIQPYLADQTAIGTDSSNYYAAGLRLNAGHQMYHVSDGDRPVPLLPPPSSDAALLSPPLLGVVWRPIALLGDVSMVLWWLAGAATLGILALFMTLTGSIRRNVVVFFIAPFIALCMWSGNVNPFIVSLVIASWAASRSGHPRVAGVAVALAAGLKLTPVYLMWWFVVRREWTTVKAFAITVAVLAAISLLGAGLGSHFEYLSIVTTTAARGASPWSVSGFLANAGVPQQIATVATFGWLIATGAGVWLLRRRPRASFVVAVLMIVYSSPVVLLGNLAMLLATTAPFPGRGGLFAGPRTDAGAVQTAEAAA